MNTIIVDDFTSKRNHQNPVMNLMKPAYQNVDGGFHYASKAEMVETTNQWRLIYEGRTLLAAFLFKEKFGQKISAFGATEDSKYRDEAVGEMGQFFRFFLSRTWIEVSGRAEDFVLKNGGLNYLVPNNMAGQLTKKKILSLDSDGFHYDRKIMGIQKTKLIVGTPVLS